METTSVSSLLFFSVIRVLAVSYKFKTFFWLPSHLFVRQVNKIGDSNDFYRDSVCKK